SLTLIGFGQNRALMAYTRATRKTFLSRCVFISALCLPRLPACCARGQFGRQTKSRQRGAGGEKTGMEFGTFMEFPPLTGAGEAAAFDQALGEVASADEWGLDAVWLAELHGAPERSVLSAPMMVASAIAAATSRVRIGIAVQVLPLSHPL